MPPRSLLDAVPIALGIHARTKDSSWTYVNPSMCALLGYPDPAELLRRPWMTLVERVDQARVEQRQRELLRGRNLGFNLTRWMRRDGTHVPVEVSAALVDFEGEPSILVVGRDLTERTQLQERLALADRMASIGTLAAGVAHEINNPLSYVMLSLELIAAELRALPAEATNERLRQLAEIVGGAHKGTERIRQVVRALKTFSRADEERRVRLDVRPVLDVSADITNNQIQHRARLTKSYGDVPDVLADEARLGQVFINLLVNAAQAIPEGHVDQNEIRVVTRTSSSGDVVIEVRDSGQGISAEVLPRIFDPFFSTKEVGEGTGLGLAICHGIVSTLGGDIAATSAPGGPTVFRVTLPAAKPLEAPPVAPAAQRPSEKPGPAERRSHVLVIDDDPMVALACRMALESEYDVITSSSGRDALDRISRGERFDAIVCDLLMPEITGMELYSELGRIAPDQVPRLVFMTGGAFTPAARTFLEGLSTQPIAKPFTTEQLREAVRRVGSLE
jgi:PAS domain S-box-containing protein